MNKLIYKYKVYLPGHAKFGTLPAALSMICFPQVMNIFEAAICTFVYHPSKNENKI